jgi:hypothetical protein
LASLAIEDGHAQEGETILYGLVQVPAPERGALARALLAESLAVQGKVAEAQKQIGSATALVKKTQRPAVQLSVRIAAARVRMASGHPGDLRNAAAALNGVLAEAKQIGLADPQMQARLTLSAIEKKSGKGVGQLEELEKDATARGFGLIARKAAKARD